MSTSDTKQLNSDSSGVSDGPCSSKSYDNEKSDCSTPTDMVNMMEDPDKGDVKMAGYLEKRGKMKLLSTWKRYWFVLEGRLLLYYRSQLEYLNLSACRGSLNMGIASCVRPGVQRGPVPGPGYIIEVVTRTQVVTLRTKDRIVQEQWLQALLDSMALPNISSPLRNSGGPLHFRYSMDNLPTVDEMEQSEDKVKDKQGTLPRQPKPPSVARRDSVLMRIKRLGGHSYGGSLDTIIRRQVGNQVQQHPKIPRIKAVDRMVGLQDGTLDQESSNMNLVEKNIPSDCPTSIKQEIDIKDATSSTVLQLDSNEQDISKSLVLTDRVPSNEDFHKNQALEIDSSEAVSNALERDVKKCNVESVKPMVNMIPPEVSATKDTNVINRNNPGNESDLEIDRLHDVTGKQLEVKMEFNDNEQICKQISEAASKSQYISIENQLYDKSQTEIAKEKHYDPSKELTSYSKNLEEEEGNNEEEEEEMYEDVPVQERVMEVKTVADDEYYSSYDQPSLILHEKEYNNQTSEPALPPRPSISSSEMPDNEEECVEYNNCYEPGANVQSELLSSGEDINGSKKRRKIKLNLRNKKSTTKDSIIPENGSNTKTRKMSFLRRMLKHYRKKSEPVAQDPESSDEPEYETVDYSAALPSTSTSTTDRLTECEEENEYRDKVFGTASLLPSNALLELRQKLKRRENTNVTKDIEVSEIHFSEDTEKLINPNMMDGNPTIEDQGEDIDKEYETVQLSNSNDPPQLPPRRTRRPSSPWHDIPTNNSPVYGNFNFQTTNIPGKSSNADTKEWTQDLQDEMLGTPQGFAYIQNKWKVAERSGEWHRELRQVSFPTNARNQGPKLLEEEGNSVHILEHDHHSENRCEIESSSNNKIVDEEWIDNVDLYSKINKKLSDKSNSADVEECSKECCEKDIKEKCALDNKLSQECNVENVEYSLDNTLSANNIALLNVQSGTLKEEHCDFQKDSLMTSMCTQTESELEDSIVSIGTDGVEKLTTEDHGDVILLRKSDNYDGATQEYYIAKGQNKTNCDSYNSAPEIKNDKIYVSEKQNMSKNLGDITKEPTTNRYSDELNLLLAQLAEITCAPLLSPGATKSLIDFPESKTSHIEDLSLSDQITLLGPIRRRRHSEPDYDVPRPHNSLLQIASSCGVSLHLPHTSEGQERDVIDSTRFFGQGQTENVTELSVTAKRAAEDALSMAPDSLEPVPPKYQDTTDGTGS